MDDSLDQAESEIVEVDPTGRYGRYDEVLGKGAFKTVYKAFDEVDGIEAAWNQVNIRDLLQSPEDLERLYSEVHLLKSLKHKNIIKLYHSWVDIKNRNVNFITEIFTSGTLRQYRKKHKHVDLKAVKNWARQILRGLLYLHSHDPPIIHRDLKCDNIFVNGNNGEVKIGDLGLATIMRQTYAAHSVIGTPEFMAPELYEEEYNELVDIYSFGMCLLEMVTFEYPYSECTNAAQIFKKVTSGKKPAALERVIDPAVKCFIEKCLAPASERLPARELLKDPFLQSDGIIEPPPPVPVVRPIGDDMDDLIGKDSSLQHASLTLDVKYGANSSVSSSRQSPNKDDSNLEYRQASKDDRLSGSRDFRVKGKKKDDNTVFLRLRIVDAEGHVSNIHFLFDIEVDTALTVASEMVAELDLSDQDVTNIADMIDQEILGLVPEWKPGASFEDSPDLDEGKDQAEKPSLGDCSERAKLDTASLADSSLEAEKSGQDFTKVTSRWENQSSDSRRGIESMMQSPIEGVTHGNGSSDGWSPCSSCAYIMSIDSLGHSCGDIHACNRGDHHCMASGHTANSYFEGMENPIVCPAGSAEEVIKLSDNGKMDGLSDNKRKCLEFSNMQSLQAECNIDGEIYSDAEWSEELKRLALKQEQELVELCKRHEQAVLEAKSRWERKINYVVPSCLDSGMAMNKHAVSEDKNDSVIASQTSGSFQTHSESVSRALNCGDVKSCHVTAEKPELEVICSDTSHISLLEAKDHAIEAFNFTPNSWDTDVANGGSGSRICTDNSGACGGASINAGVDNYVFTSANDFCVDSLSRTTEDKTESSAIAVATGPINCGPGTNKEDRIEQVSKGRRESYIDLYKSSGFEGKKQALKCTVCSSEACSSEVLCKSSGSKHDDQTSELKRVQLQKSIAELEAKTLEGLHCSRNGYLPNLASTKPWVGSGAQFLSSASQTRSNDSKRG